MEKIRKLQKRATSYFITLPIQWVRRWGVPEYVALQFDGEHILVSKINGGVEWQKRKRKSHKPRS